MVDVSVVMSVFNGAQALPATLDSILSQQGCHFEFIVVNDGSTDASKAILDARAASDSRLRVIHQTNTGLTRALIRGCAQAKGDFIARQDCGDLSLPGRLARQCEYLRTHPDTVMVACAASFVGPGNEPLYVTARAGTALHQGLAVLELSKLEGPPHHGATMFRQSAYLRAGGYRPAFAVAQDIDLWLRLCELGSCAGEPEVGYQARLEAGSISASRRAEQVRMADLALQCARRRRSGLEDAPLLQAAPPRQRRRQRRNARLERARFLYFIGSCLQGSDPAASRQYYLRAFREHPLLVKGLIRFAMG